MLFVLLTLGLIGLYGVFHHRAARLKAERPWSGDVRTDIPKTHAEFMLVMTAAQATTTRAMTSLPSASMRHGWPSDTYALRRWGTEDEDEDRANNEHAVTTRNAGTGRTL